jgi:hypothetical protein
MPRAQRVTNITVDNLLTGLISSKTRIKLLVRLFFNPQTRAYLRELAKEFNVSTNAVREELNQLKKSKLLKSEKSGRQVFYRANTDHALFPELKSMVSKVIGIEQVIEGIVSRLGDLKYAFLIDDYAVGKDTGIIDLILVGNINQNHLIDLQQKTEKYIDRKIRTLILTEVDYLKIKPQINNRPKLLIWNDNQI